MGWDGRERRKQKRYGLKDSLVRYRRGGLFSPFRPFSPSYLLLNFSREGCHFISRKDHFPGSALDLRLEAPERGSLGAKGVVAWSKKSDRLDAYKIGIRFTRVSGRSKILLQKLLDSSLLEGIDITTKVYLKEIEKL